MNFWRLNITLWVMWFLGAASQNFTGGWAVVVWLAALLNACLVLADYKHKDNTRD